MSDETLKANLLICISLLMTSAPAIAQEAPAAATPLPGFPTNSTTLDGLRIPQIFNNPTVPTDTTGIGGGLGHARGLKRELDGPEAKGVVADAKHIKADPRYVFHGPWLPLGTLAMTTVRAKVATTELGDTGADGERIAVVNTFPVVVHSDTRIMPTANAEYTFESEHGLLLSDGAMLVKTGKGTAVVSSDIGGKRVSVSVAPNSVALMSAMDNKLTVCNFQDGNNEGCTAALSDNGQKFELTVPQARLAEFYPSGSVPAPNQLAAVGREPLDRKLSDGRVVRTMYFDYTKAMKNYSIAQALPSDDFERMLKVAAASSVALRTY